MKTSYIAWALAAIIVLGGGIWWATAAHQGTDDAMMHDDAMQKDTMMKGSTSSDSAMHDDTMEASSSDTMVKTEAEGSMMAH